MDGNKKIPLKGLWCSSFKRCYVCSSMFKLLFSLPFYAQFAELNSRPFFQTSPNTSSTAKESAAENKRCLDKQARELSELELASKKPRSEI
jgi:hypothetical protein